MNKRFKSLLGTKSLGEWSPQDIILNGLVFYVTTFLLFKYWFHYGSPWLSALFSSALYLVLIYVMRKKGWYRK